MLNDSGGSQVLDGPGPHREPLSLKKQQKVKCKGYYQRKVDVAMENSILGEPVAVKGGHGGACL